MIYRFGPCELDTERRRLRVGAADVAVEPKAFDLLFLLAEHAGELVARERLVERLWQGRIVTAAAIDACISRARRAVGDSGRTQRLIETVPRCGLRLVPPVTRIDETLSATAPVGRPEPFEDLPPSARPSIAVLPFARAGDAAIQPGAEDAVARDVTIALSRIRWLFVTARASVSVLWRATRDPGRIARGLGVRYLLDGRATFAPRRLSLDLVLLDATTGETVWTDRVDHPRDDIPILPFEVSERVAIAVMSEIDRTERRRALEQPIAALDAWTLFHRAHPDLFDVRGDGLDRAQALLDRAAAADPTSARIAAARSFAQRQRALFGQAADREAALARAFEHAREALHLDPLEPSGHWVLGRAQMLTQNYPAAAATLRTTTELAANFANGHAAYGNVLQFAGGHDLGIAHLDRACRLSPYDPLMFANRIAYAGHALARGDHAAAADHAAQAAADAGTHAYVLFMAACCQGLAGRVEAGRRMLARLREQHRDFGQADFARAYAYPEPQRRALADGLARLN